MLSLRSVNHYYGHNHSLWDLDLDLPAGSCTGVIGQTGMGKTTLVNCITGHLAVNSGSIVLQQDNLPAADLLPLSAEQRMALGISYVPQNWQLFSQFSVEENLHIALLAGAETASQRTLPGFIYHLFPTLYRQRQQRCSNLSTGDRPLLALARALVCQPGLLIVDQFRATPEQEAGYISLLQQLTAEFGMTVLLLEQQPVLIRHVAHQFVLLHHGRNVAGGPIPELNDSLLESWFALSS